MFEVWLQMSDTNIDRENPSDLPALMLGMKSYIFKKSKDSTSLVSCIW